MSKVAYNDKNDELCEAAVSKSYSKIKENIKKNIACLTYYLILDNEIYGYDVQINESLSEIFHGDFFVCKFVFSEIETMHNSETEQVLIELLKHLKQHIDQNKGYYNLRIPTHILDLMRAYNEIFDSAYLCGGTVEQYVHGKEISLKYKEGFHVSFCDEDYLIANKEILSNIIYNSFSSYQGQYHISPITEEKAGEIYKKWTDGDFKSFKSNTIVVAKFNDVPCGFITIGESDTSVEAKLGAVSAEFRGLGTYRNMIGYIINYANKQGKSFLSSTQFDNFTVQGAWADLGLKPFYSIYNVHIDNRFK